MKPTTPLPWKQADGHFQHVTGDDLAYIIHAANAYPRLVGELRRICDELGPILGGKGLSNALLRELGEQ